MSKTSRYIDVLTQREFIALAGRRWRNIIICSALMLISLGAVCVALGGLEELRERMANPFTNWVDLPVLYGFRDSIPVIQEFFEVDTNRAEFGLSTVVPYWRNFIDLYQSDLQKTRSLRFISVVPGGSLEQAILRDDNILWSTIASLSEESCGMVLSERAMNDLDLEWNKEGEVRIMMEDVDARLVFDVKAIVKEMPGRSDIMITNQLAKLLGTNIEQTGFRKSSGVNMVYLTGRSLSDEGIRSVEGMDFVDLDKHELLLYGDQLLEQNIVYFNRFLSKSELDTLNAAVKKKFEGEVVIESPWDCTNYTADLQKPHYIAFNFSDLRKVVQLKDWLNRRFGIELEMAQVENKENFTLVSRLTLFSIVVIVVIAVLSFSVFLYFLVSNHLQKISRNIGMLMAMGLGSDEIVKVYVRIVRSFILRASLISFILLMLIYSISQLTQFWSMSVWNIWVPVVYALFLLCGMMITASGVRKLMNNTPGNLIYER